MSIPEHTSGIIKGFNRVTGAKKQKNRGNWLKILGLMAKGQFELSLALPKPFFGP